MTLASRDVREEGGCSLDNADVKLWNLDREQRPRAHRRSARVEGLLTAREALVERAHAAVPRHGRQRRGSQELAGAAWGDELTAAIRGEHPDARRSDHVAAEVSAAAVEDDSGCSWSGTRWASCRRRAKTQSRARMSSRVGWPAARLLPRSPRHPSRVWPPSQNKPGKGTDAFPGAQIINGKIVYGAPAGR